MIAGLVGRIGWPYLVAGVALVASMLFGATYWKGYSTGAERTESKLAKRFNEQLAEQIEREREAHSRQLQALQTKTRGEREAESIRDIALPDGALCSAGDGWLYAIQDGIERANRAGRTTGTAARTD